MLRFRLALLVTVLTSAASSAAIAQGPLVFPKDAGLEASPAPSAWGWISPRSVRCWCATSP